MACFVMRDFSPTACRDTVWGPLIWHLLLSGLVQVSSISPSERTCSRTHNDLRKSESANGLPLYFTCTDAIQLNTQPTIPKRDWRQVRGMKAPHVAHPLLSTADCPQAHDTFTPWRYFHRSAMLQSCTRRATGRKGLFGLSRCFGCC